MRFAAIFIICMFSNAFGSFENSGNPLIEKLDTSCLPSSPPFTIFSQRIQEGVLELFEYIGLQGVQFSSECLHTCND